MQIPKIHMVDLQLRERHVELLNRILKVSARRATVWDRLAQDHPKLSREKNLVPLPGSLEPEAQCP